MEGSYQSGGEGGSRRNCFKCGQEGHTFKHCRSNAGDGGGMGGAAGLLPLIQPGSRNSQQQGYVSPSNSQSNKTIKSGFRKAELCNIFDEFVVCSFGNGCNYAHGREELRAVPRPPYYKTLLCWKFHIEGLCYYGRRCVNIHNWSKISTPMGGNNENQYLNCDVKRSGGWIGGNDPTLESIMASRLPVFKQLAP